MTPEIAQRITKAVEGMPAFPGSVQKILVLTRDVNCTPKDLVDVIDKDPVVTVKILKVVNSAYYGLPRQITSIGHAVVFLGFNTIKNLAISIAAIGMLPKSNAAGFDVNAYLLHSLSTAGLAKQLATKRTHADAMDCFIAGLLHDFGKVVFAQFLASDFKAALAESQSKGQSLHVALQAQLGTDHTIAGAMLLEKWRFERALVQTIRNLQTPALHDTDMMACVFAANQISKKLRFGDAGNPVFDELPPTVAGRLGGTLDTVIGFLGDIQSIYEDAKVFANL
jgi:HD-like signal output (HDOD) protein